MGMLFPNQLPFVKLLLPFLVGIAISMRWPVLGGYSGYASLLFLGIWLFLSYTKSISTLAWIGLGIGFLFLSLGSWLTFIKDPHHRDNNLGKVAPKGVFYIKVSEIPEMKVKTFKIEAVVLGRIGKNGGLQTTNEKALLYFDKTIPIPKPGDHLLVRCIFKPIPEPENPFQFNYKRFLKWQGISYRAYINDRSAVFNTHNNQATFIGKLAYKGNRFLTALFRKNISDKTILGVTESLIFGYKDNLGDEIVSSYSRTGTLHVLAVSGLHVAIVFLIFARLLWFMDRWRYGSILKTITVLLVMWVYCIITGMAPSILRAGLMISLVVIGKAIHREGHILNSMSVSAFLILCVNPFWLVNIGFQLSFAAVLGIVYLKDHFMFLYKPKAWLLAQVWDILSITLCAQLATFPLCLYYFNQFPNYFLVSNLIIIPLTTLIVYTGIGMIVFHKVSVLLQVFTWLLVKLVYVCNAVVSTMEALPYAVSDGVKVTFVQLILIYIGIVGCMVWLIGGHKKAVFMALGSFTILIGIHSYDTIKMQKQSVIAIFNIPKQNALVLSDGTKSILISDQPDSVKLLYYLRGWLIDKRIWPIYKHYNINAIKREITSDKLGLHIEKGVVYYRGTVINFSKWATPKSMTGFRYIIPDKFHPPLRNQWNTSESIYVGHAKSEKMEQKIREYLSENHFNVISYISTKGYTEIVLTE